MNWLLRRTVGAMLAMIGGAVLGLLIGSLVGAAVLCMLLGAAMGVSFAVASDAFRGRRLMRWLRGTQQGQAPRDSGFWGELAYRVERALRIRSQAIEIERRRLEQFLSAMEASPNGVLLLDANDQIDWCNKVAADHFGLDPARDRRQRVTNLVRTPAFVSYLQEGRYAESVSVPGPLNRSTLSVVVRPFGDGMKLVLSQDVTERERNDAMRRDFVANVSHEIRTPLTVLAGFVETMDTLPLTPAERQRVLNLMTQQTDRMQSLVNDLLALAQIEGSPRPPADRWLALPALFKHVEHDAVTLSAGRHTMQFSVPDNVEIAGSDTELLSAIGNIVNNAVRYTPAGGRIDVSFGWRDDGAAFVEVLDTGVGIAREHLPRLTERFYRVDSSRSRETGGTGLGLSIVKHVVQRHGGEIDIDSEPGKGSRFRLVFPAARVRRALLATAENCRLRRAGAGDVQGVAMRR
jgi:two-component system, OmpR family, phosphate regulon sensor histidine kinase PhoR